MNQKLRDLVLNLLLNNSDYIDVLSYLYAGDYQSDFRNVKDEDV